MKSDGCRKLLSPGLENKNVLEKRVPACEEHQCSVQITQKIVVKGSTEPSPA